MQRGKGHQVPAKAYNPCRLHFYVMEGAPSMALPGLRNNVKFKRLVLRLGLPRPYVIGLLDTLWECSYDSGDPYIGTADDVEVACEWPGKPGELFQALYEAGGTDKEGFVRDCPGRSGTYEIHNFLENAPQYVRDRFRKRVEREKERLLKAKELRSICPGQSGTLKDLSSPSSPPLPSPQESSFQEASRAISVNGELLKLVEAWNENIAAKGLGKKVNDVKGKGITEAWAKTKEPSLRKCFEDIPKFIEAVKRQTFLHTQPWFTLQWVLKRNDTKEWNAQKILDDHYTGGKGNGNTKGPRANEQSRFQHNPNAAEPEPGEIPF